MYLAVAIDGDYVYLSYKYCDLESDVFDWFKKFNSDVDDVTYEVNENEKRISAEYYVYGYDSKDFSVCQYFELTGKPYLVVWWHAYNGVDFRVKEFNALEDAHNNIVKEIDTLVKEIECETYDENYRDVVFCWEPYVVDTGDEWQCWQIIKVNE